MECQVKSCSINTDFYNIINYPFDMQAVNDGVGSSSTHSELDFYRFWIETTRRATLIIKNIVFMYV